VHDTSTGRVHLMYILLLVDLSYISKFSWV